MRKNNSSLSGQAKKFQYILTIGFLLIANSSIFFRANGQIYYYQRMDMSNGLPSTEVFDIKQDKNYNLWFATESGICKYDGYTYKIFNTNNGMPANSVLKLQMDKQNRLWYFSFSGHIGYISNDEVFIHPANHKLRQILSKNFGTGIHLDGPNTYLNTYNGTLYIIDSNNNFQTSNYFNDTINYSFAIATFKDEFIYSFKHSKHINYKSDTVLLRMYQNKYYFFTNKAPLVYHCSYFRIDTSNFFISLGNRLFHIKNNRIVNSLELDKNNSITNIYLDESKNLWINTVISGTLLFKDADISNKPEVYFENKLVSRVFQDHESNYWFTTTTDGIFFTPSIYFKTLKYTNNTNILAIGFMNNNIYYATYFPGLFKTSISPKTRPEKIQLKEKKPQIKNIIATDDKYLWLAGNSSIKINSKGKGLSHNLPGYIYALAIQNDSNILLGGKHFFADYNRFDKNFKIYKNDFNEIVMAIYKSADNTIWLGTLSGLYASKKGYIFYYGDSIPEFKFRVTSITGTKRLMMVGTNGAGLLVWSGNDIHQINDKNGLPSNVIRSILIENDSNFWVGTNKGLSHLIIPNVADFAFHLRNYSKSDGLIANNINQIKKHGDHIFMATDKGIIYFNPDNLKKTFVYPKARLIHYIINDMDTFLNIETLKYNQNNISFHFKAISYKSPDPLTYKIKLENYDHDWITTNELLVRYTSLPPGKYTFKVMASIDGKIFGDYTHCTFKIQKHFVQTFWFIILVVVALIGGTYMIITSVLNNHKRKNELQNKILLSEQKALRMQMNPHFIFNALGSIQNYILENESQLADLYLSDFSYLMRMTLEHSKHNFVPLSNELESIQLYLKLEKLRFDDTFDYHINISEDINVHEMRIPPLLIQPFIENAIWHGLLPKKGEKKLNLDFKIGNQELLLCTITDNGVGIENSQKSKVKYNYYKSTGIKNIKERIDVINLTYKAHMKLDILTLVENNQPMGTEVQLYIYYVV